MNLADLSGREPQCGADCGRGGRRRWSMMRISTISLVLALGSAAISEPDRATARDEENDVSATEAQEAQEGRVVLEGVVSYRVPEPLFECVKVVLSHRGAQYSTAYLQGISGAAFRIAGICPCAPTCSFAMETQKLAALLGYEAEMLVCEGGGWERGEKNAAARLARMAKKGVLPPASEIDDLEVKASVIGCRI